MLTDRVDGRRPLRDWIVQRLIADVVARGGDKTKAQLAVTELVTEKPILEWLIALDWQALITLVLRLILLVAEDN